ncbi:MAG: four helix bundle protein [Bacteroidetes bacterium]|nr:four helix bundle protein [Bacteroidota bacterium]
MDPKTQLLLDRTFEFGIEILKFLGQLPFNKIHDIPKMQLARAATSIGANYEESQAAESKRDFCHKIGVVCKESRECVYWLRVLLKLYSEDKYSAKLNKFLSEAKEFKAIFTSIKMTAEGKKRK